jgi:hypothetical protein
MLRFDIKLHNILAGYEATSDGELDVEDVSFRHPVFKLADFGIVSISYPMIAVHSKGTAFYALYFVHQQHIQFNVPRTSEISLLTARVRQKSRDRTALEAVLKTSLGDIQTISNHL